jgi:2-oxoglutarate dehydrogenase E2 component (dihydrolipoamide succinyltransferase)
MEVLSSFAVFQKDGDKVARVVFGIGDHTLTATRVDAPAAPAPAPAAPAPAPAAPAPAKH